MEPQEAAEVPFSIAFYYRSVVHRTVLTLTTSSAARPAGSGSRTDKSPILSTRGRAMVCGYTMLVSSPWFMPLCRSQLRPGGGGGGRGGEKLYNKGGFCRDAWACVCVRCIASWRILGLICTSRDYTWVEPGKCSMVLKMGRGLIDRRLI